MKQKTGEEDNRTPPAAMPPVLFNIMGNYARLKRRPVGAPLWAGPGIIAIMFKQLPAYARARATTAEGACRTEWRTFLEQKV